MVPLEELYCLIDDFCKQFQDHENSRLLPNLNRKRIVHDTFLKSDCI